MIIKSFELQKINLIKYNFLLFYGKNEGLKTEAINKLSSNQNQNYDEDEILKNKDSFIENLLSKSFFDNQKIIVIKRATDKLVNIISEISEKDLSDTVIIICSGNLEKRSKLRLMFEKEKKYICTAFYPDNEQTLLKFSYNFLKERNIPLSSSNINLIINKSNGDRQNLINELNKIESFCNYGKKINLTELEKLINLTENHSISELFDNCLLKNEEKVMNILNDNSFNNEDAILIIRTFLNKSKKLFDLSIKFMSSENLELTISSAKPPIFWKDKEITKKHIVTWKPESIKKLIYKLNELELLAKKNLNLSISLITDFILNETTKTNN